MNAANRQAILSAGGAAAQLDILKAQGDALGMNFASVGDRTKYAQGQMSALALAGIKPSIQSAGLLNNEFKRLQKISGMTGEAFNKLTEEFAMDSDIQIQLRAASVQMGMTEQQAKAVNKTLAKMAGQGPIDRIKQAAKMRAMGGAMGVAGADEAARIHIKGQRATEAEKETLRQFASNMSNKMSESQTGSMGGEIFAATLSDKLGMTQLLGPGSDFNTRQAKALEIDEKSLSLQEKMFKLVEQGIEGFDMLKAGASNPVVQSIASLGALLTNLIGSGVAGIISAIVANKLMGGGGGVPSGGGGGGGRGGMGRLLSGTGAKVLGTVGAVGMGAYQAYDTHSQFQEGKITEKERNKEYGSAAGGAAGALAGSLKGAALGAAGGPLGILLGGLIGGGIGAYAGSAIGGGAGGLFGSDDKKSADLAKIAEKGDRATTEEQQALREFAKQKAGKGSLGEEILSNAAGNPLGDQLLKLDTSNSYLKSIQELTEKQLEIAEKQLAATVQTGDSTISAVKSKGSGTSYLPNYGSVA
jgi:hypothetical protein